MKEEGYIPIAPSRRQLLWLVAAATVVATVIFVIAVLPVEFRVDPSGVGRFVGLDKLAGPAEVQVAAEAAAGNPATYSKTPFRTDTVDIPLKRGGTFATDELEWKVRMKGGDTLVYSWTVPDVLVPDEFYFSFHGQSEPQPGDTVREVKVTTFLEDTGTSLSGTLVAPYDGLWGWYLQNQTDHAVVVRMKVAGYYEIASQEDIAKAAAAVPPPLPPT